MSARNNNKYLAKIRPCESGTYLSYNDLCSTLPRRNVVNYMAQFLCFQSSHPDYIRTNYSGLIVQLMRDQLLPYSEGTQCKEFIYRVYPNFINILYCPGFYPILKLRSFVFYGLQVRLHCYFLLFFAVLSHLISLNI